ncbi:beta-ketoacyl-[acyl-carrier-protein] synthase family protein [Christiangramia sp. ASW11-125]|uniref:beta-ketoacyl-[acyl-carrier-protein] synthase family protein n=1 Tax=Christiangramia sp. ASW11-125 TaxID=3400701 RepID=UPI003AAC2B5B
MSRRVVITGLGVAAPNAIAIDQFDQALRIGNSGIKFHQDLKDLNFSCQIGGKPPVTKEIINKYFNPLQQKGLNSSGLIYGVMAGVDAWKDALLPVSSEGDPDWNSGIIFGTGILGVDKFREAIHLIDAGKTRRLGSTSVIQTMASGISAYLGGMLGCGNQVTTNSSACTTGNEAIILGYDRIISGKAQRMLVGSCGDDGPYVWGGFDAMRILPGKYNDNPEEASRPMSATASGFVPGSGAGALLLESLESALQRGANIYAEVLGGAINSGGQRAGGSMTAANNEAVQRCIKDAISFAGIQAEDIDYINGHLTATTRDATEIENWTSALGLSGEKFPKINSLKGMTGHCLSASGSIESVASILQIKNQYVFGNINCEDVHQDIIDLIDGSCIPKKTLDFDIRIAAKASFGFGDVNAVTIFKRYKK